MVTCVFWGYFVHFTFDLDTVAVNLKNLFGYISVSIKGRDFKLGTHGQ